MNIIKHTVLGVHRVRGVGGIRSVGGLRGVGGVRSVGGLRGVGSEGDVRDVIRGAANGWTLKAHVTRRLYNTCGEETT